MRRLTFTNAKLRGKRRLFKWLRGWAESFAAYFPDRDEIAAYPYWNWKIPVPLGLVEGKNARPATVRQCAQLLIDATARLIGNRPDWARGFRMVCSISVPDAFGSEVCIYMDEEYYRSQISSVSGEYECKERIVGKSLAKAWTLVLPEGFQEVCVRVMRPDVEDGDYRSEWWFFGEVGL